MVPTEQMGAVVVVVVVVVERSLERASILSHARLTRPTAWRRERHPASL